jgi:acetyl esterase/lipase
MDEEHYDKEFLSIWREFPLPFFAKTDVEAARSGTSRYFAQVAARSPVLRDAVAIDDFLVPSRTDSVPIPVRIYRPREYRRAALVYLHGSGFSLGDLEMDDERCVLLARDSNSIVISVDYRLGPEYVYPVPLEDCYSAVCWVVEHAEDIDVNPRRIGIGGTSAGAAHAAGVAQLALDRGGPSLAAQMLLYPALDASMSSVTMRSLPLEKRRDIETMWGFCFGPSTPSTPSYGSPASRGDLTGLPPAYIAAAEFDLFRDEAVLYASRLLHAGVHTELHVWPRVPHAFDQFVPEAGISKRALAEQAQALVRLLG